MNFFSRSKGFFLSEAMLILPLKDIIIFLDFAREKGVVLMSEKILYVTDGTFGNEVLESDKPVLVDFYADWCGPCVVMAPVIEKLAEEYDGKVKVAKMNVDNNPATPTKYGIRGIPTLILFKDGKEVDREIGAVPKSRLDQLLGKVLSQS